jgi:pimeloyl-ACP methyl ester carboxylesterase
MDDGQVVLHTLRQGEFDAVPLVLLHGFPLDHRMWADVVDLMPGDPTILAPDLPGFGQSPTGPDIAETLGTSNAPSIEVMADGVVAALRASGVNRAVVAGLSMGGYVAMAIAERHPGLLAGLGLLDTKSIEDAEPARQNRLAIAERVLADDALDAVLGMSTTLLGADSRVSRSDLVERLQTWITDQGPQAVAWAQRAMAARPDRTESLHGVNCPAVVVVGEQDELSPVADARHMLQGLTDAELVVVAGSGHMTAIENPEPVAAALSELLARASRPT